MIVGNLVVLLVELIVLGIVIYGVLMMIGGPRAANGFARGVNRTAQRGVRHVGRGTGRMATRHSLVTGLIVIIVLIMALSKC